MKFMYQTTQSGDDTVKVYDMGDEHYGVVHVIRWDEYDSSVDATYNATASLVCLRGFESYGQSPDFIGQSVHDALQSCGWRLDVTPTGFAVECPHSGDTVMAGPTLRSIAPVIIEAMWGYGAHDRIFNGSSNNRRELETQARRAL